MSTLAIILLAVIFASFAGLFILSIIEDERRFRDLEAMHHIMRALKRK